MSEHKFTPGPWFTHRERESSSTMYVEARIGGGLIQEVAACGPTNEGWLQTEANANLIAAAPDLYKALERLLSKFDIATTRMLIDDEEFDSAYLALAKARGKL